MDLPESFVGCPLCCGDDCLDVVDLIDLDILGDVQDWWLYIELDLWGVFWHVCC